MSLDIVLVGFNQMRHIKDEIHSLSKNFKKQFPNSNANLITNHCFHNNFDGFTLLSNRDE